MSEELFSKEATRKILKISRARYQQFIDSGILPKPFEITPGSRPVHSETQIKIAEKNLYERAVASLRKTTPGTKPIKPLNPKINYKNLRQK